MGKSISIYAKHVDENNFALGQNGFDVISGSAYITQSNDQFNWYWLYAVTESFVCAKSYLGNDFVASASFAPTSGSRTLKLPAGTSIYGSFSAISQSTGLILAYRG
jgi:hypothetical protein